MTKQYILIDRVKTHGLALCSFSGTISRESILPLIAEIELLEAQYPEGFRRFSDLSGIDGLTLSAKAIREIAELREKSYRGPAVQSAIHSPDALTYGMMRIYGAVMFPTKISVKVFYQRAEAALWLDVPEDCLRVTE